MFDKENFKPADEIIASSTFDRMIAVELNIPSVLLSMDDFVFYASGILGIKTSDMSDVEFEKARESFITTLYSELSKFRKFSIENKKKKNCD